MTMRVMMGTAGPQPATARREERATKQDLCGRRIAFTTPLTYAGRLSHLLRLRGAAPLSLPTVAVEPTPSTLAALRPYLLAGTLDSFSAVAFTSRNGISAFSLALPDDDDTPPPLADSGEPFTVAALGKDADLLREGDLLSRICRNPSRIRIIVPETASPAGLVESLGDGSGRRVLCPVPNVVDLEEPPVVADFVADLEAAGWVGVRVPAYETRWAGPRCAEEMARRRETDEEIDAIVFTSSAEVEGLMKGLHELGWDWKTVRRTWPEMVVAAHGPVTARGVERFGICVDVVSARFDSFDGVLDALASRWKN
ncbi:uncharacterized protein [Typha angustifolia]|uniref:uncharacterized protein n=1 Tax=Typha angustifolia TaxID=59011 RepID=UPI003C2D7550